MLFYKFKMYIKKFKILSYEDKKVSKEAARVSPLDPGSRNSLEPLASDSGSD
jgi:hypothetical protein